MRTLSRPLTKSASDFTSLVFDEESYTIVLIGQLIKEHILEPIQSSAITPRGCNDLPLLHCSMRLDQVLEFLVIDIV
jgi:hypothetical protein